MNWEIISVVANVIAAIAVVISLIYLGKQVSFSNRLSQAEALRVPSSDQSALNSTFSTIPVFNLALRRVLRGEVRSSFNEEERAVLDAYMISITNLLQQIYREVRIGIVEKDAYSNFTGASFFDSNYYKTSWPLYKHYLNRDFASDLEAEFQLDPGIEALW